MLNKTERFQMRCDLEFFAKVDAWRLRQPGEKKPARAEAIRQLVDLGLAYDSLRSARA